jgi:hypothetical protein
MDDMMMRSSSNTYIYTHLKGRLSNPSNTHNVPDEPFRDSQIDPSYRPTHKHKSAIMAMVSVRGYRSSYIAS